MGNWKRILILGAAVLVVLAVVVLGVAISLSHFLVDLWWFNSLNYGGYFWLRLLYRYILSGGVTLFFFLIFFLNFWAASRYLGVDRDTLSDLAETSEGRRSGRMLRLFQTGSLTLFTPLSLIMAVAIAWPFYQYWERGLLFFFGPASGVEEPVFRQDVSFYLFELPLFQLIQLELLAAFGLLAVVTTLLYWMEHQITSNGRRAWPLGAKIHLSGLVLVTGLILAWGFLLQRYDLLNNASHEPVFYGPGFVELRYHLPLIWIMVLSLLVGFAMAVAWFHTGTGLRVVGTCVLLFLLAWGLRQIQAIPELIERFIVKPNPVKTEREFMKNNIDATLAAYDLDKVREIDVTAATNLADILDPHLQKALHNIPVWDPEFLDDVYQQLQGIRPYYYFSDVDTARYAIAGQTEQVNLAARELNTDRLPDSAKTWENLHLRYTHGYGAVITPAAQEGGVPMQWFLRDLNLQSDVGFSIDKPDIYFGQEKLDYAIVPNRLDIVGLSSFDVDSSVNYTGRGGIPIQSLFSKLIIAIYLKDEKLFFSINIDEKSKVLLHRNIVQRIHTLTPYLALDHDPYIVVTPTRVFWIQDAYTTADKYPISKSSSFIFGGETEERAFNYMRNSVKIVVDSFDGTVDYYVDDPSDPIIQAYRKAYPGLFKDIADIPPLLRDQLRYPKDYFSVQMRMYTRYHQKEPELFYQQAETWDLAKVQDRIVKPYYLTTFLAGCPEMDDFVLIDPLTPIGRSNLSALAIGGAHDFDQCGIPYSKQIMLYKFRKDVQVDGPSQVSALIDQDPDVAQQFTLWDQKGSHVIRGRIIILPVGNSIVYVQPVYLVSTSATKIPELTRVILSMGNLVVMETSLQKAFAKLEARLKAIPPRQEILIPPRPPAPTVPTPGMPSLEPMR